MKSDFSKASFVDVRTPEEYGLGHYPGAVNIPLNEVLSRIDEFKDMRKPVVLYCRSGNRSGMAATLLKQTASQKCTTAVALTTCRRNKTLIAASSFLCRIRL